MDLARNESKRRRYDLLHAQLMQERSSFIPTWRESADFILPRRPRFFTSDTNQGGRRNQKIIDSTGSMAVRTLRSGMMAGITSPARPWFRLTTPDPALAEFGRVKEYLHVVGQRMNNVFIRSNIYNVLPIVYGDIGVFATGAMSLEEDFDSVIRCYPFPIGSYCISNNEKLKVDTFTREFRMTVRQIVQRFGQKNERTGQAMWENFSTHVKAAWDRGDYETWIDVTQVIKPNEDFDERKLHSKHKKFASCYFEKAARSDIFLSEKGYDYFPILSPRWEITGEDSYGTECPATIAIGDIKQLQHGEKRGGEAIDKKVRPAMIAPTSMRQSRNSTLPGDITYADEREGQKGFRPAHEVNLSLAELENKQDQIRNRIQRAFYEDLFLMLANSDRRQITAREIEERHEEKLLALGPVLEQLNQDLLDPLIDITFDIMVSQNMLPIPPEELQGVPLKVEYISVMAQAQKLVGIGGLERFARFTGEVAAVSPDVMDKWDTEQTIDEYAEAIGVSPRIIRSDEAVAEMRANRAKAQQAQAMAEAAKQGASAMKDLSQADTTGDNALTQLMNQAKAGQMVEA